jgi:cell wall-associated NlpC family hydrolase
MRFNSDPSHVRSSTVTKALSTRKRSARHLLLPALLLTGGCSLLGPAPEAPPVAMPRVIAPAPARAGTGDIDTLGLVAYAASMQGKPYVSGGQSPTRGFDCSGLVHHVFGTFDFELPRNAASMAAELPQISLTDLQAADLVFFNTQGNPYSHVGIYLGDGRFVHAPSPRTGRVIISAMSNRYWNGRLTGARRPAL